MKRASHDQRKYKQKKHFLGFPGGCDATLRAAEETDLMIKIEQHELELPPDQLIETLTKNNFVTVFAKSYCPYSKRTKAFFKSMNVEFKVVDLDTLGEHGKDIQAKLKEITGQSTVPNVWVQGKFIGTYKYLIIFGTQKC